MPAFAVTFEKIVCLFVNKSNTRCHGPDLHNRHAIKTLPLRMAVNDEWIFLGLE